MSKKSTVTPAPLVMAIVLTDTLLACGNLDAHFHSPEEKTGTAEREDKIMTLHAPPGAAATKSEATRSVELTRIAAMSEEEVKATLFADETATAAHEAEEIKATLFAEEACILAEGEGYSWEYTDLDLQAGSGATSCQYTFSIKNTSDEHQTFMLFGRFDNAGKTGGMEWEKWNVRGLAAQDSYACNCSYTWYENGDETWYYATNLLVVRGIPECRWLIPADDASDVAVWDAYGTPLENPCR
jgi:hypothetical protein